MPPIGADRYGWNTAAARFYDRTTGRYVSRDIVRSAIDDLLKQEEQYVRKVSEQLRRGQIDLASWQHEMRQVIKDTHLQVEALARGGWEQLTQADYGRVGAAVREQYQYLDKFTSAIAAENYKLDGRFITRAVMYAKSARPFFHDEQRELLEESGYTHERNVLHPAEHCQQCLDQSALGWVLIGTVVPIGDRQCLSNDRCTMRYRATKNPIE